MSFPASTTEDAEDNTGQVAVPLEGIATHLDQLGTNEDKIEMHMKGSDEMEEPSLHLASLKETFEHVAFTAQL